MKRAILAGMALTLAAGLVVSLLWPSPAFTQRPFPDLSPIKPAYTPIGVASLGNAGSAAWLHDPTNRRLLVCTHGTASGCTAYDLP